MSTPLEPLRRAIAALFRDIADRTESGELSMRGIAVEAIAAGTAVARLSSRNVEAEPDSPSVRQGDLADLELLG